MMRKLFNILPLALFPWLLALASCATQLTAPPPPPVVQPSDLSSFFWPDSTATYQYQSSTGDLHTISVYAGGNIVDKVQRTGASTTLTLTRTSSGYSLSGFSPADFLGFDPWFEVVSDTAAPSPRTEAIRSIAAMNPDNKFGFGSLFASSDSVLYRIDMHSNTLNRLNVLPANGLTLAEDVTGAGIYAIQLGGTNIFWTSDNGSNWKAYSTSSAAPITAFASANPQDDHAGDLFWIACGSQIYRFSSGSNAGAPLSCSLGNITALEAEKDGVIAATDSGAIYDINRSGLATLRGIAPGAIRAIALNYFSTSSGVFDFTHTSFPVDSNDISVLYSTGYSIFGARSDGSVDHFSIFGPPNPVNLPAPNVSANVTQFAFPYQGSHDPNSGIYVVAGGKVFYRQNASMWAAVDQTISAAPQFNPGALTLLRSDTTWIAGYVERVSGGTPRGYSYQAESHGPYTMALDNVQYNNVLIVTYASRANGIVDTSNVPQYNIYFQKGVGPIRIERTENGLTTTTRLLR